MAPALPITALPPEMLLKIVANTKLSEIQQLQRTNKAMQKFIYANKHRISARAHHIDLSRDRFPDPSLVIGRVYSEPGGNLTFHRQEDLFAFKSIRCQVITVDLCNHDLDFAMPNELVPKNYMFCDELQFVNSHRSSSISEILIPRIMGYTSIVFEKCYPLLPQLPETVKEIYIKNDWPCRNLARFKCFEIVVIDNFYEIDLFGRTGRESVVEAEMRKLLEFLSSSVEEGPVNLQYLRYPNVAGTPDLLPDDPCFLQIISLNHGEHAAKVFLFEIPESVTVLIRADKISIEIEIFPDLDRLDAILDHLGRIISAQEYVPAGVTLNMTDLREKLDDKDVDEWNDCISGYLSCIKET